MTLGFQSGQGRRLQELLRLGSQTGLHPAEQASRLGGDAEESPQPTGLPVREDLAVAVGSQAHRPLAVPETDRRPLNAEDVGSLVARGVPPREVAVGDGLLGQQRSSEGVILRESPLIDESSGKVAPEEERRETTGG